MTKLGRWILVWVALACAVALTAEAQTSQPPKAKAPAATAAKIDLNGATQAELEKLPGVGEATAKKIIAGRPYKAVTDLEKAGVNKATIEKITSLVSVGPAAAAKATETAKSGAAKATETAKSGAAKATDAAKSTTAKATDAAKAPETVAKTPPQKGMVWVNTDSGIFHKEGDRWYGKTKQGEFMTEADALKKGYRAAKN